MANTVGDVVDLIEDLQLRASALDILRGQIEVQTSTGLGDSPWSIFDEPTMRWLTDHLEDTKKNLKKEITELKTIPLEATGAPKKRGRPRKKKTE